MCDLEDLLDLQGLSLTTLDTAKGQHPKILNPKTLWIPNALRTSWRTLQVYNIAYYNYVVIVVVIVIVIVIVQYRYAI